MLMIEILINLAINNYYNDYMNYSDMKMLICKCK